ncbi:MAG: hypothetical protein KME19_18855 [Microcoleus vaginatus WJT46-NPBG5]|jgi:hypothetical protein|nr:hypothetical protein [Microcoleus vaginatus WJT46-NPBG5]
MDAAFWDENMLVIGVNCVSLGNGERSDFEKLNYIAIATQVAAEFSLKSRQIFFSYVASVIQFWQQVY